MKRAFIGALAVIMICGALPAKAQFEGSASQFVAVTNTQLGNLGYTRYRGFGARALGMGGAFIALADDLTATTWNPAGLGQLDAPTISVGGAGSSLDPDQSTFLYGITDIAGTLYDEVESASNTPFRFSPSGSEVHLDFVSAAYPVRLSKKWRLGLSASYFTNLVFDQDLNGDVDPFKVWFRRYGEPPSAGGDPNSTYRFDVEGGSAIQTKSGGLATYTFSGGFSFDNKVYFGFSANYWDGTLTGEELLQEVGQFGRAVSDDPEAPLEDPATINPFGQRLMDLSFSGWSFSFGALFKPSPRWRIGVVYKPAFDLDANGCIHSFRSEEEEPISNWPGCSGFSPPDASSPVLYDFDGGTASYPDSYGVGVAWSPAFGWTLTADWSQSQWSTSVLKSADGLTVMTFPSLNVLEDERDLGESDTGSDIPEEQKTVGYEQFDASVIRLGGEYVFAVGKGVRLPVRAGGFYEEAYRNAPGAPAPLKVTGFTAGMGLEIGRHWDIDFAAVFENASQSLDTGDVFYDLTRAGTDWYRAEYNYTDFGSEFKQSSIRLLLNAAYKF